MVFGNTSAKPARQKSAHQSQLPRPHRRTKHSNNSAERGGKNIDQVIADYTRLIRRSGLRSNFSTRLAEDYPVSPYAADDSG